jgi:hypothetical protein
MRAIAVIGTLQSDTTVFLVFGLQCTSEILIGFVCHDVELVYGIVEYPLTVLIDRQPQAPPNFLPLLHCAPGLIKSANLEDVWVVPAFTQGGMAEDESQRLVWGKQLLLVLHDEVVDIIVGLRIAFGVLENALSVLCKVAVVKPLHRQFCPIENTIARLLGERGQLFVEPLGKFALRWPARRIVIPVARHAVDKEQAQDLDAAIMKLQLLVEMLLHRMANLHTPYIVAHSTDLLTNPQRESVRETDEFRVRLGVDLGNPVTLSISSPLV